MHFFIQMKRCTIEQAATGAANCENKVLSVVSKVLTIITFCFVASYELKLNGAELTEDVDYLSGRNYSYAVYNSKNQLRHSPIEHLEQRLNDASNPISDIYVVSHGWNFTLDESFQLYENYRLSIQDVIGEIHKIDRNFEPYFIFISWNSVTRPLSNALLSLSAFKLPGIFAETSKIIDSVVFHIPSNWGETQNALRIAIGAPERLNFDVQSYPQLPMYADADHSEYDSIVAEVKNRVKENEMTGYNVPVSVLLDKIIRLKFSNPENKPRFAIHTVGHSFGAKIISLASLDASARHVLSEEKREENQRIENFIDSMILINSAMKISEMMQPLKVMDNGHKTVVQKIGTLVKQTFSSQNDNIDFKAISESIKRKCVVFTRHDSATGWLFSLSQFVLSYDALAEQNKSKSSAKFPFDLVNFTWSISSAVGQTVLTDAGALLYEPPQAVKRTLRSNSFPEFAKNLFSIPLSPLLGQYGVGSQGFHFARKSSLFALDNKWLSESVIQYISNSDRTLNFKTFSEDIHPNQVEDSAAYYTIDAQAVYDGHITKVGKSLGKILNFIPPAAHGDRL